MTSWFMQRNVLLVSAIAILVVAAKAVDGPALIGLQNPLEASTPRTEGKKKRIVFFASHPEDPVFACGGLIARLTKSGHEVIVASATSFRGNRMIGDEREAVVRRREATAAYEVLGATPHFFDFDHNTFIANESTLAAVSSWIKETKPDIIFAHWPLDTHPNRHVAGSIIWQSYLRDKKWSLYFFEGLTDYQTVAFSPEIYVDVTEVHDLKREACFRMPSTKPESIWIDQDDVQRRRGVECGPRYAEAFVLAEPGPTMLPSSLTIKKKKTARD